MYKNDDGRAILIAENPNCPNKMLQGNGKG